MPKDITWTDTDRRAITALTASEPKLRQAMSKLLANDVQLVGDVRELGPRKLQSDYGLTRAAIKRLRRIFRQLGLSFRS
jgi:hypothetical protein